MPEKQISSEQALQLAYSLAISGNYDKARDIYQALSGMPAHKAKAKQYLADLPSSGGNSGLSEKQFAPALREYNNGNYPTALEEVQRLDQEHPGIPYLLFIRGMAHSNLGDPSAAIRYLENALEIFPAYFEASQQLGRLYLEQDKLQAAEKELQRAISIRQEPTELNLLGNVQKTRGQLQEAAESYQKAIALAPDTAELYANLGIVQSLKFEHEAALKNLNKALQINPAIAEAQLSAGLTLLALQADAGAITHLEKAIELKPDYVGAHYALCGALEKLNRIDDLKVAIRRAGQHCDPKEPLLALRTAQLQHREGNTTEARAILESIMQKPDGDIGVFANHLLGHVCDREGDHSAAFGHWTAANELKSASSHPALKHRGKYLNEIRCLNEYFESLSEPLPSWQGDDGRTDPIFMVGFPRSGTTLLDTILRSHGQIHVVEEEPLLLRIQNLLMRSGQAYTSELNKLDQSELGNLRRVYFEAADSHLDNRHPDHLFVDKLPLNIIHLGLINQVFPNSRIIFSQRHPCDCVLSCFMQGFTLNAAMVNFLDLEDAARLYDAVFKLFHLYREILPLQLHTVVYETLVEDFDATVKPLISFLGLEWSEDLYNYRETAMKRGRIKTPSYRQVNEALYSRASQRWLKYRSELEPVLPLLTPWAEQLGYK